jgi:hypothetical protein
MSRPIVLELCAGAGGQALGLRAMASGDEGENRLDSPSLPTLACAMTGSRLFC